MAKKRFRLMSGWSHSRTTQAWYGEHYDHNLMVTENKETGKHQWRVVSKYSRHTEGYEARGAEATAKKAMNAAVRDLVKNALTN